MPSTRRGGGIAALIDKGGPGWVEVEGWIGIRVGWTMNCLIIICHVIRHLFVLLPVGFPFPLSPSGGEKEAKYLAKEKVVVVVVGDGGH